jgi:hypothetical protein
MHTLTERANNRGLARREEEPIEYAGIDETSFGRAQDHISLTINRASSSLVQSANSLSVRAKNRLVVKTNCAPIVGNRRATFPAKYEQIEGIRILEKHWERLN